MTSIITALIATFSPSPRRAPPPKPDRHIVPQDADLLLAISCARSVLGKDVGLGKLRNAIMEAEKEWVVDSKRVRTLRLKVIDTLEEEDEEWKEDVNGNLEERKKDVVNERLARKGIEGVVLHAEQGATAGGMQGRLEGTIEKPEDRIDVFVPDVPGYDLPKLYYHNDDGDALPSAAAIGIRIADVRDEEGAVVGERVGYMLPAIPECSDDVGEEGVIEKAVEEHNALMPEEEKLEDSHNDASALQVDGCDRPVLLYPDDETVLAGRVGSRLPAVPECPDVPGSLSLLEAIVRARVDIGEDAGAEQIADRVTEINPQLVVTASMVEVVTESPLYKELYQAAQDILDGRRDDGEADDGKRREELEEMRLYVEDESSDDNPTPETERTEEPKPLFLVRAMLEAGYDLGYGAPAAALTGHILDRHPTWIVDEGRVARLRGETWTANLSRGLPENKAWTAGHVAVRRLPDVNVQRGRRSFKEKLMAVKAEVAVVVSEDAHEVYDGEGEQEEDEWKVFANIAVRFLAAILLTFFGAVLFAMYVGIDGRHRGAVFDRMYGNYSGAPTLMHVNVVVPEKAIGSFVLVQVGGG